MVRHRLHGLLVVGLVAAFASGCVAGQAEVASPSSSAVASAVASQGSPAAPSRAPTAQKSAAPSSPAPSPARSTPSPETELEALLPNFIGADYTTKRAFTGVDLAAPSGGYVTADVAARLFATTGMTPDALEGARAWASRFDIVAMRMRGMDPGVFVDAFIDATMGALASGTVSSRTVDGNVVRLIQWPADALQREMHVMAAGGIVFVASPFDPGDAQVDAVFRSLFQPRFEEILPAELEGRALVRFGVPGIAAPTGGDMCWFVCPNEPHRIAAELKVSMDAVDLGVSVLDTPDGIMIVAMRFKGVSTDRLIQARIVTSTRPEGAPGQRRELTIAGKQVTLVDYGPFGAYGSHANASEFLFAKDDVLFILRVATDSKAIIDDIAVPPILESAMRALP